MEYKWDVKELKRLKENYIDLLKTTQGLTKNDKNLIQTNIKTIRELENILNGVENATYVKNHIKYLDKTKHLPKETYENYKNIPKEIRSLVLNAMKYLIDYEDFDEYLPKINLSDNELVDLSYEFFEWLPESHYQNFFKENIMKKNIVQFKSLNFNYKYNGVTYSFEFPYHLFYILVNKSKTLNDFITLNHEVAHATFTRYKDLSLNCYYLNEIEGYFFDFLSIKFLDEMNIVSKSEIEKLKYKEYTDAIDNFYSLFIKYLVITTYYKKQIKKEDIAKKLIEYNLFDVIHPDSIDFYMDTNPENDALYALSYLASLDLEKMYEEDKEKAFYILNKIRSYRVNNIIEILKQNEFTFMDDGYMNLKRKLDSFNER